ncbi:MAG TPA: glycosyltransferase family 4 protein [Gemmatimonadales bacterium]|nr:glycosyltransferase family 4 protein [Gemmatimonadales bacterium]
MRILHLVTAFPRDERDIIAPWLVELIKRQRAAGHDAQVFAPAYHASRDHEFAGIPVHRFRYFPARWEALTHDESAPDRMQRSLLFRLMPVPFVLSGVVAVWRLCRRERYDVIHVHWPVPLALWGWAARRAGRKGGRAGVVLTFYGIELRWVKRSLPFLKGFVRWACRTADRVVAISTETAREIRELSDVPVAVIPYTTPFATSGATRSLRACDGTRTTVLFIGRLVELKGLSYLIEAAAALRGRIATRIIAIGIGPERQRLEQLARDRQVQIDFRNKVPDAELHQAFLTADMLVLPSIIDARGDTEGLGVALLDAMSYGLPAIASRVGGIPDIIEDGVSGLLVPPANARALADAIERVARDPAYAQRLADAGRERLRTHFSWDVITKQWEAVYRTISADRPSLSSSLS